MVTIEFSPVFYYFNRLRNFHPIQQKWDMYYLHCCFVSKVDEKT